MVQVSGIEGPAEETSISKLRDPSAYKTVVIEGKVRLARTLRQDLNLRLNQRASHNSHDDFL